MFEKSQNLKVTHCAVASVYPTTSVFHFKLVKTRELSFKSKSNITCCKTIFQGFENFHTNKFLTMT